MVHAANAGLILNLAQRRNRLPTEATLEALATAQTENVVVETIQ